MANGLVILEDAVNLNEVSPLVREVLGLEAGGTGGKVCECVWYLCVRKGSKYFKAVSHWLTLVADLYGTLNGRPLWIQFDDVVVLAVVFFVLLSRSIGFQIFGNLKDIPLI